MSYKTDAEVMREVIEGRNNKSSRQVTLDPSKKTANTGDVWIDYLPEEYYEMYEEEAHDPVNHPPHYKQGEYETIDVIKDITNGYSGYEGYLVGNVTKYLYRANFKGKKAEDLRKAEFYLKRLVEVQHERD